jgi:hypothetical protein
MSETFPACRIHEKWEGIKCEYTPLPGDADGFCIFYSRDRGKNPDDLKAASRPDGNRQILRPKHLPVFRDSFFYLVQKATLQRPTWAEPVGFWGKLVAGFSVLLIPGQAALFLLALRNPLGRRR